MTKNTKSGDLPTPVEDLPVETRELIVDNYLNRTHLVREITGLLADEGLDLPDATGRGHFTKDALAAWFQDATGKTAVCARSRTKGQLASAIAAEYDVDVDPDRDTFSKIALIRLYIALATGDTDTKDVACRAVGKPDPEVPTLTDGGADR